MLLNVRESKFLHWKVKSTDLHHTIHGVHEFPLVVLRQLGQLQTFHSPKSTKIFALKIHVLLTTILMISSISEIILYVKFSTDNFLNQQDLFF